MGLQGPPYAVLSPLVTDPLAPPGDPESSLFLTCHFVLVSPTRTKSPDWANPPELIKMRFVLREWEKKAGQNGANTHF